jgi:adenylate kinase family enzyme
MIWINGPFGVGKTTVAKELQKLIPGSVIFDPEKLGYVLQRLTRCEDFRELAIWEWITLRMTHAISRSGREIIVPMSIASIEQMKRVREYLWKDSRDAEVIQLVASRQTILDRILQRDHATEWGIRHLDEGIRLQEDPIFGNLIDAEVNSPEEIAKMILAVKLCP